MTRTLKVRRERRETSAAEETIPVGPPATRSLLGRPTQTADSDAGELATNEPVGRIRSAPDLPSEECSPCRAWLSLQIAAEIRIVHSGGWGIQPNPGDGSRAEAAPGPMRRQPLGPCGDWPRGQTTRQPHGELRKDGEREGGNTRKERRSRRDRGRGRATRVSLEMVPHSQWCTVVWDSIL